MKKFKVKVSPEAEQELHRRAGYLALARKNPQAARNFMHDYRKTRLTLEDIAGSIREPDSEILKRRNLKRLNFRKMDYFLLFKVEGNTAIITNIFHASEDFENKLS